MAQWGTGTKWGKGTKWGSKKHSDLADQYGDLARKLLPRGVIWTDERIRKLALLLRGWADEWARVSEHGLRLIEEVDPRTTVEAIGDWERILGLPDPDETTPPTLLQDRRDAVVSALIATGGSSPQYFIDVALALGVVITITEQPYGLPSRCGVARCGDPIGSEGLIFVWRVNAPIATLAALRSRLESKFNRIKPAHTVVEFVYS